MGFKEERSEFIDAWDDIFDQEEGKYYNKAKISEEIFMKALDSRESKIIELENRIKKLEKENQEFKHKILKHKQINESSKTIDFLDSKDDSNKKTNTHKIVDIKSDKEKTRKKAA